MLPQNHHTYEPMANSADQEHEHDDDHQAPNIIKIDVDRLAAIHEKISIPPKILSKTAGRTTCSIFKAPKSFTDVNGRLYQPQIISIGPYHHGLAHVQMMEEHKYQYLGQLLGRTNLTLLDLFNAVAPLEEAIRECYSEIIHLDAQQLLEMMVVDGCFILEFFRKVTKIVRFEAYDPIALMSWIFPALQRDLHRLENQIPFFVLQCLFELTFRPVDHHDCGEDVRPLATLCLDFFNYSLQRPDEIIWKYKDVQPKHLLDLLRSSFITQDLEPNQDYSKANQPPNVILSLSSLARAGIELQRGNSETFLAVKFKHGVIEMPTVAFDDFMSSLFANCVVYEQCHTGCFSHFTAYAILLDCLVDTAKEVEYLCDKGIIENYLGTKGEVATFVNNMGKEVAFDIDQCYLAKLFHDVNEYYENSWHVQWTLFKYTSRFYATYFSSPWTFISAVAAFILLVLTILQTLYSMLQYYQPLR